MKTQFKYHDPIKEKPTVPMRVIVAILVSIAFTLFLVSVVVWVMGR